jgi:hypothetical protein
MSELHLTSMDEQGRRLAVAFLREESASASTAPTFRERFLGRKRALALAASVAAIAAAVVLLSSNPFGKTIGVQEALGSVAARIALVPNTPADEYTHSTYINETVKQFEPGYDRFMQPYGKFTAISRLRFEFWLSRKRDGITRGDFLAPRFPSDADRKTWERVYTAEQKWKSLTKTMAGRKQYAPLSKRYLKYVMSKMNTNPFFDPVSELAQEPERGWINPDLKYHVGYLSLTQRQVDAFPREPRATYDKVKQIATASGRGDGGVNDRIWRTLTEGAGSFDDTLPSDLRAAFVSALQYLPGIKALGRETDSTGRAGEAFEWESNGQNNRVVFDARTAVPIELVSTLTDPEESLNKSYRDLPKGTVVGRWLLEQTETTRTAPPRPH